MISSNCQFAATGDDGKPLPLDQEVGVLDKIVKIVDICGYHAMLVDSIVVYCVLLY